MLKAGEAELRAALEQSLLAIKRIYAAGHDSIKACGGSCDSPAQMYESDPTVREIRQLLDRQAAPCASCGWAHSSNEESCDSAALRERVWTPS